MLYSALLVAATALTGFAAAQNDTDSIDYPPVGECCNVTASAIPSDQRTLWCRAQTNTCPEVCGGSLADVASGGNTCNSTTLEFNCECRNGTSPDLSVYQQSVEGQMCIFWYNACIAQSGDDRDAQFQCDQSREQNCGNETLEDSGDASASPSASGTPTETGSDSQSTSTSTSSSTPSTSSGAASALEVASQFGTPALIGGIIAVFGFAL